ncbi:hypothetical protein Bca4012_017567 [Brassica carinata]
MTILSATKGFGKTMNPKQGYECKLCQTLHNKEGNYMAHTQGMRHQPNLAKRAARETLDAPTQPQPQPHKRKVSVRRTGNNFVYLGESNNALQLLATWGLLSISFKGLLRLVDQGNGSSTTPELMTRPLLFQNEYPEIEDNIKPKHRVMSSFEQVGCYKSCEPVKPQSSVGGNGLLPPPPPPPQAQPPPPRMANGSRPNPPAGGSGHPNM